MKATYMWSYKDILNDIESYVRFLKKNQITDLYLQFTRKEEYIELYRPLIRELNKNGITAHATGGASHWALDYDGVESFITAVEKYNATVNTDEMFSRIHFDIEPYTLPEWKTDKENVINKWMNVVTHYKAITDISISAAIPFWLAKDFPDFYKFMVTYHDHLTVMAYRDTFEGSNSFSSVFEPNITIANEIKAHGKLVAAVELAETSEGPNLTFNDDGIDAMNSMLNRVNYEYYNNPSFKGVAIHHLKVWKEMSETPVVNKSKCL